MKTKGQSIVELAILLPVLIIIFIGVLEVGYALRNYMVLLNASREAARFMARGAYDDEHGFAHFLNSISGQVDVRPGENATIYFHHATLCPGSPFSDGDEEWEYHREVQGELLESHIIGDALRLKMIDSSNDVNLILYEREVTRAEIEENAERYAALLTHDFETAPIAWDCEAAVMVEVPYLHSQLIGFFGKFKLPMRVETTMRVARSRKAWQPTP